MNARMKSTGWAGAIFAVLASVGFLTPITAWSHDFGGNSQPEPRPTSPDDPPCRNCCTGMGGGNGGGGGGGPPPGFSGPQAGDPINLLSGAEQFSTADIQIGSMYPIVISRRYDSQSDFDTALGYGWAFTFDRRLFEYPDGSVTLRTGCGQRANFVVAGGSYITPRDSTQGVLTENPDGTYEFRYYTGAVDIYDADGRLAYEKTREGFAHEFLYDSRGKLPLTGTSPHSVDPSRPMIVAYMPRLTRIQERSADGQLTGFAVDFTYNEDTGRLTQLDTSDGRSIAYTHDVVPPGLTSGNLLQVTGLGDLYHLYRYEDTNDAHNLTWIQKGLNATPVVNTYDSKDRVVQQVDGAALLTVSYVTARTRTDVTQKVFDDQGVLLHTNSSRHYFDEAGYPTSEVNPAGQEFRRIYSANKDVERVELRSTYSGTIVKSATYTHDGQARLLSHSIKLDAADGGETITRTYAYDDNWLASEQVVSDAAPAKIFRTEYSFLRDGVSGPPVAIHEVKRRNDDGSFATTAYEYCSDVDVSTPGSTCPYLRLLKEVDGPRTDVSDVTTYTYYPETDLSGCSSPPVGTCHRKGQLWKTTNALGHVVENVRYDAVGRLSRVRDANGVVTDLEYDPRDRLVARKIRGSNDGVETDDAITLMAYDDRGNSTQVTQPDGSSLSSTYDAQGRLTGIEDAMDNRILYVLDSEGNRLREDTFDPADFLRRTLSRSYTNLGQIQQLLNAQGTPSSFTYTVAGMNDLATDALGRITDNDYDDLDRLTKTVQDKRTGGLNATVKYSYDAADNLRKVIDPSNLPTEYVHDALGNLVSLTSPDTGTTSYSYDAAGNRTSQTDARGVTSSYSYDQLNRLASISYPDTALNVIYAYDQGDGVTGCTGSFPAGRVTQMQDASGTTTYCYDRRGNVTRKVHASSMGPSHVTEYSYTLNDHLASIVHPSGAILTYTHDAVGRLQGAAWQENALATPINLVANAGYAPFGALTSIAFGNGRTQTRTYDQDYAIDSITGTPAGALTLDFGVDAMGNIVEASGSLNPATPDRVYTYDALYRLTMAATGTTPPATLEAYTYNATGDRLSVSLNGDPANTYTYVPNTHRLASVGAAARTYDDNGNTLTGLPSGYTLTYDDRNRLHQATKPPVNTATYGYNGKGERVAKVFSNGLFGTFSAFAYDEGGKLLGEYDDVGNVLAEYVYLDDMPIAVIKDATPYYLEADHLGTPRQVIDPLTNTVLWKWDLLESTFGTNAPNDDPDGDGGVFAMGLRLPGQYLDGETDLHYNYFRDYEPGTGRYIESDPIGLSGGVSASLFAADIAGLVGTSTYSYAMASPINKVDSKGLLVEKPGEGGRDSRGRCRLVIDFTIAVLPPLFGPLPVHWKYCYYCCEPLLTCPPPKNSCFLKTPLSYNPPYACAPWSWNI